MIVIVLFPYHQSSPAPQICDIVVAKGLEITVAKNLKVVHILLEMYGL